MILQKTRKGRNSMKKSDFLEKCKSLVLLDGATGTNLQYAGMPSGVCPEAWILDNPDVLQQLQKSFYESGSNVVYAFSFGANKIKLARHNLPADQKDVIEMNKQLASISCQVRDDMKVKYPEKDFWVAGDLSPTGLFLKPAGDLDFDDLVEIYKEQVIGLEQGGVDLFVVETMMDLAQTRAAVIAIREASNLPIMVSFTLEKNGRTLSGNSFETCLLSLACLDVQAVGLNCSSGPMEMVKHMSIDFSLSTCEIFAKPNAGVPSLDKDGKTVFDMNEEEFAEQMLAFLPIGVKLFGGCCGTTPAHIKSLYKKLIEKKTIYNKTCTQKKVLPQFSKILSKEEEKKAIISSGRNYITLSDRENWPIIICHDIADMVDDVLDYLDEDPEAICIDLNQIKFAEQSDLIEALTDLQMNTAVPLIFKCDDQNQISAISRYYNGLTAFITNNAPENLKAYLLTNN